MTDTIDVFMEYAITRIKSLQEKVEEYHYAVQHVTEGGFNRRSYTSSDSWAMVHAERLRELEEKEEKLERFEEIAGVVVNENNHSR